MQAAAQRVWVGQVAVGLLGSCLIALVGRLGYIQTQMRPHLLDWSQKRQSSTIELSGQRGRIMDRRLRVLAGSHAQYTLFADPLLVSERAQTAMALADIPELGLAAREILQKLDRNPSARYVVLKRGISSEAVEKIEARPDLQGIGVLTEPARVYAMGTLAAHVLGFVGMDENGRLGLGLAGVEMTCHEYLKDRPGKRVVYWDARRRNAMFEDPEGYIEPKDGLDVVLTIDAAIQEVVERELAKTVEKFQAECAMGVVMSPKTGELLALAISPTFDPGQPGRSKPEVWRNRVLTDPVEPGSIFKPFVMVGALQAGLTRPDEVIDCENGCFIIGKRQLHDAHPNGLLTVEQVIGKSSNIGMAKIGLRMGNKRMYETLHELGFGERTGIDLPGEDRGLLMPLSKWGSYTTTSVPMGQEVALTPIQLVTAFCALINGGKRPRPYVIAGVVDRDGRLVEDRRPKDEPRQVVTPAAAETVKQMLIKAVNEGTGSKCQLDHWQALGKTGTAQVPWSPEARRAGQRKGYEPDAYLGSFLVAAPASDPQLVVLVMVRKPLRRIAYYGGTVAAPTAKSILEEVLPYLNLPPDKLKPGPGTTHLVNVRD